LEATTIEQKGKRHQVVDSKAVGPGGLEPPTYGLKALALGEYLRPVMPQVGTTFGSKNPADVLRAIARRDPGAAELAEAFARELLEVDDPATAARAALVAAAFEAGSAHALTSAIDLFERVMMQNGERGKLGDAR